MDHGKNSTSTSTEKPVPFKNFVVFYNIFHYSKIFISVFYNIKVAIFKTFIKGS